MSYKKDIIKYYDSSQWLYSLFVYDKDSLGMHFGFWDKNTKNRHEAIINENEAVVNLGKIKKGMKILDAGCGVGGTAIYIAKKTGAKVWGITLSDNQVRLATNYAEKNGISGLTEFSKQDYNRTNFQNNFFDIIYGIESICHAYPKSKFLKEAKRILKPGGKLLIIDGYSSRAPSTQKEKEIIKKFKYGFVLKELITYRQMTKEIKVVGFVNVKEINKTENVKSTAYEFKKLFSKTNFLIKLISVIPLSYFHAVRMSKDAMTSAYQGFQNNLAAYYVHYAEKSR